ncbi:MAG: hypothetical protein JRH20_19275 [Deltaproteobacteria bacterium]|nr:hypothetical protein [Deltaproteobacteria bacterium]
MLKARDGSSVRIDASTKLRFQLRDDRMTDWVRGADLATSSSGVVLGKTSIPWSDIEGAEVKNFSGGKTAAVTILSAAVVVAVVAYAVSGAKGSKGSSGGKGRRLVRGSGRPVPPD